MKRHWKAIVGVLVIFTLGFVSGVLGTSIVVHHRAIKLLQKGPQGMVALLESGLSRRLDLDASQKAQVHDLLMANLKQRQTLQQQIRPQVQELNRQTLAQIEAVLRPGQKEKLEEAVSQLREKFGEAWSENTGADPAGK